MYYFKDKDIIGFILHILGTIAFILLIFGITISVFNENLAKKILGWASLFAIIMAPVGLFGIAKELYNWDK
jgi:multisubunit Na+/H+ antiporter MnhG subunit